MKANLKFLGSAIAGLVLLSGVFAIAADAPKGNEGKGRYYFRQTCKGCHTKEAKGGEVTPLTKTQAQWKAFFLAAKHNRGVEPLSAVMSADQLRDVQTYLHAHAADSPQPETCGK